MANLVKLCLLECESNKLYTMKVTQEIYDRASEDMVFATELLRRCINDGITVFDGPLKSYDLPDEDITYPSHGTTPTDGASTSAPTSTSSFNKSFSFQKKNLSFGSKETNQENEIHNWSKNEVLLLISIYKEHQLAILDENANKGDVWKILVNEFNLALAEKGLPLIDEKKCRTKMDSLKRHYKKVKDSNKKSGNQQITWQYYDEMEEIFGEQPWIKPLSTAGSNIPDDKDIETTNRPSKRQKTLKDYCEVMIQKRQEDRDIRNKQHAEKIAVSNKLADAVSQLVGILGKKHKD